MADYTLAATKRPQTKKSARDARQAGNVPGVVYGHGFEPTSIAVNASDILRLYRKAGSASLIEMDVEGTKSNVLIHEMTLHPVRNDIYHVDFLAVNMNEKVTVHVPFVFNGESQAVKLYGGVFMAEHTTIDLRCLPADIPHDIEVDISVLKNKSDHVCVKDLGLDPSKFEVMNLHPGDVICSVAGKGGGGSADDEEAEAAEGGEGAEGAA